MVRASCDELLTFRVINNTKVADTDVYITIIGFNKPAFQITADNSRFQGFIQFQDSMTGVGTFTAASAEISSKSFSYQLSSFPQNTKVSIHSYELQIPYIDSAVVFFSIQGQLDLTIRTPESGDSNYPIILEPVAADPKDVNYGILYDKIGLSFLPPNIVLDKGGLPIDQLSVNVNTIDFFAIPMSITIDGSFPIHAGIRSSRPIVINNLRKVFGKNAAWNSLFINDDMEILRILSPGYALKYSKTFEPKYFDPNYLEDWMNEVWFNSAGTAYYQKNILTVKSLTSNNKYYGLVSPITGNFEFWASIDKKGAPSIIIGKADNYTFSEIVFGAITPWPESTSSVSQDAIDIGKLLQAGIMTGYLPTTDILSKENLIEAKPYINNPNLTSSIEKMGPWYDLYAAAIYPYGSGSYSWRWDDLVYTSQKPSVANWTPTNYIQVELSSLK